MNTAEKYTQFVKELAAGSGFYYCGISKAEKLDEDAYRLEQWLNKGMHGKMTYMENYFDLRRDPALLVPGAKSVITLLMNYYPSQQQSPGPGIPKIAKYAYGKDYHEVIRAKLNTFLLQLQEKAGNINGRGFVDSAPVLERAWAKKSGAGWIGKNGNLITKQQGSFFFIATLITDLELVYNNNIVRDYCGSCRKCIEACPTDAILPEKVIDGSKCISYFTIELKDLLIPDEYKGKFNDWMFGCDICQDVCPWNRFSQSTLEPDFQPLPEILNFTTKEWEALTEDSFRKIFRYSPLKRSKYAGIQRNLKFIRKEE